MIFIVCVSRKFKKKKKDSLSLLGGDLRSPRAFLDVLSMNGTSGFRAPNKITLLTARLIIKVFFSIYRLSSILFSSILNVLLFGRNTLTLEKSK